MPSLLSAKVLRSKSFRKKPWVAKRLGVPLKTIRTWIYKNSKKVASPEAIVIERPTLMSSVDKMR
jgi:hypothetical protein